MSGIGVNVSDDEGAVHIEVTGLEALARALRRDPPTCRLGILGGHASRRSKPGDASSPTNAEIGALYEFNDGRNPNRPGGSFLRVPLIDHLESQLQDTGLLDQKTLERVIATGTITPWVRKLAIVGEKVVMGAFATEGYGKWKPSDMTRKKNAQTLVETGQLRNSISSEVTE